MTQRDSAPSCPSWQSNARNTRCVVPCSVATAARVYARQRAAHVLFAAAAPSLCPAQVIESKSAAEAKPVQVSSWRLI
jgi:hypothetical protein